MKNLIKNVVRSFKNNKLSIIGLVLLLFFGLGVFCVMSNTTANIKNEYTSLAKEGNLHDLTVAELYDVGQAQYRADHTKAISYTVDELGTASDFTTIQNIADIDPKVPVSSFYYGNTLSQEPGVHYVPMPEQTLVLDAGTYYVTRTYYITLDETLSTGLYQNYATEHVGSGFVQFKYVTTKSYSLVDLPTNVSTLDNWDGQTPSADLVTDSVYSSDYHDFNAFISDKTSSIYSLVTTDNTPLAKYIDSNFSNEMNYRYFKSINVTASKDNIYYKIINSNPEDRIDKMVLFEDPNERFGNKLYSTSDWAPYNSRVQFVDQEGEYVAPGTIIPFNDDPEIGFVVPADFNELVEMPLYLVTTMENWSNPLAKFIYSQIIQIRFKRMMAGSFSAIDSEVLDISKVVAAIDITDKQEYYDALFTGSVGSSYDYYVSYWYASANETINISANGNVVFTWTSALGIPSTDTISNWTSKLAIVNPQHLEKSSQRVLTPDWLHNFKPYKQWHKQIYGSSPIGEISPTKAKNWFNTLTSDQFSFWIDPTDWTSMTYQLPDGTSLTLNKGTDWNGISSTYLVNCSGYNEVIWGCGLTPDFMYPVVDISRPTPNTKTECLVYTNDSGYNSIKLAFVNSPVEDYLVAKFKASVNTIRRQDILKSINTWATSRTAGHNPAMIYPEGTQVAFFADDASNVLNCSGFRIAYIPNLVRVVQTVSTILCVFIGILCLIICFVIIKRYVENNRINIGIMRANGIKKWKIALSLFPFALVPAVIGGIAAYVIGLLLQGPMLLLFSNYWMLPTPLFGFDWVSFLVCIFGPFLLFTLICFISTFIVLRISAVQLMKAGSEFKTNGFSRIAKKPFKHFGILTRFRVSLAFNSITRLLILAAMSCLTMSSLVFAMTTFDKLNQSKNINSTQFDYDFNVELTTPTSAGGPYAIYDYSQPLSSGSKQIRGFGWTDPSQYLFNIHWDTTSDSEKDWYTEQGVTSYSQLTKPYMSLDFIAGDTSYMDIIGNNGLLMIPSAADATGQNEDLMYLQNKRSSRLTLNYDIGFLSLASNPWEIALAMMPANSRSLAADSFNNITNAAGHKVAQATQQFITEARKLFGDEAVGDDGTIYYSASRTEVIHQIVHDIGSWFKLGFDDTLPGFEYWYPVFPHFFTVSQPDAEGNVTYTLKTDMGTVGTLIPVKFNTEFISLITTIYQDADLLKMEYPIEYGSIPLNWDLAPQEKKDETYTYIDGYIKKLSSKAKYDANHQLKIEGIKKDTNYVFLTDKNGHSLNERLWSENYLRQMNINNEDTFPIIINAYAAHKYKLKVGSTITTNVVNDVDRFLSTYNPDKHLITFKVVGVSSGTNNEAFYTTQDIANDILGLPNNGSWNRTHKYMIWSRNINTEWTQSPNNTLPSLVDLAGIDASSSGHDGNISIYNFSTSSEYIASGNHYDVDNSIPKLSGVGVPTGFNGVYTHNKTGKPITAGLSLYSYAGLYPGSSVFKSQSSVNKFTQVLSYGANLGIASLVTGIKGKEISPQSHLYEYWDACYKHLTGVLSPESYTSTVNKFIDELTKIYGDTTMVTAICGAMDVAATDLIYNNLISTFNLAETTIMSIIIPITIIIVAVISNLIINDSKRMAAMLKALGYSDVKNLMSILALFIPTLVLGVALAIPLSFGLTLGYQSIIFNTANILVDVTQKWWYYVAAIGGIGAILIVTYTIGYVSLKRSRLVDQIK